MNISFIKIIPVIKVILVSIIVLYHSMLFWNDSWLNVLNGTDDFKIIRYLTRYLGVFHVYTFTFLSGYLFAYQKNNNSYKFFSEFVKNKIKRLIIPYISVSCLWLIPFNIHYLQWTNKDIIEKVVLCVWPSQLWYCIMLFNVFLISYFLYSKLKYYPIINTIILIAIYFLGLIGRAYIKNYFTIWTICEHLLFFWLGYCFYFYSNLFNINKKEKLLFIFILHVFTFIVYDILYYKVSFEFVYYTIELICRIIGVLNIVSIAYYYKSILYKYFQSEKLQIIIKNTFGIYLFHQQLIYVFINEFYWISNPWLQILVNLIFSFILSLGISALFNKFKLTRFMIGTK